MIIINKSRRGANRKNALFFNLSHHKLWVGFSPCCGGGMGHTLKMLQISIEEAHFLEQNGAQKFVFRRDLNAIK